MVPDLGPLPPTRRSRPYLVTAQIDASGVWVYLPARWGHWLVTNPG